MTDPLQLLSERVLVKLRWLTGDHTMIVELHISLSGDVGATTPEVIAVDIWYGHSDTVVPVVIGRMMRGHHNTSPRPYGVNRSTTPPTMNVTTMISTGTGTGPICPAPSQAYVPVIPPIGRRT